MIIYHLNFSTNVQNSLVHVVFTIEVSLNYFDHNHRHIVSHKLVKSVEHDTWNDHPYHIHH